MHWLINTTWIDKKDILIIRKFHIDFDDILIIEEKCENYPYDNKLSHMTIQYFYYLFIDPDTWNQSLLKTKKAALLKFMLGEIGSDISMIEFKKFILQGVIETDKSSEFID
jgi:hypothetical protein